LEHHPQQVQVFVCGASKDSLQHCVSTKNHHLQPENEHLKWNYNRKASISLEATETKLLTIVKYCTTQHWYYLKLSPIACNYVQTIRLIIKAKQVGSTQWDDELINI
jgi:hypothetical protein